MIERATVQQVNERDVLVELRPIGDCGGCTACAGLATGKQPQSLRAINPQRLELHTGDQVEIGFASGKALKAGFVVLILPLLLFLGAYALVSALGVTSDPLRVLAGMIALAGGLVFAWLRGRSSASLPEVVGFAGPDAEAAESETCSAGSRTA